MKNILRDERGSILPMFAVALTLAIMVAAVAVDFSRYALASEKLQTAVDSAALAAASTGFRYVTLEIDRGQEYIPCDLGACCISCGKTVVTGKEEDLIDKEGWKQYVCNCGSGSYNILDRWVEYPDKAKTAKSAQLLFELNKPKEMDGNMGESEITDIKIFEDKSDPRYPSVMVKAKGKMKTIMMNSINKLYPDTNFTYLNAGRCSQSETFYKTLNGKYVRTADEGCE